MALVLDVHVAAQVFLYLFSAACSLVVSIPLGVTQANFKGMCMLYTEFQGSKNDTTFTAGSTSACRFPLYLTIFAGIFYSAGMSIYYIYALCQKDPNIGSQMWVWPFTIVSWIITFAIFIGACIISVGFKTFCDNMLRVTEFPSCADGERMSWHSLDHSTDYDGSTFYSHLRASEGAAWVLFLDWVLQSGLGILRIVRNHRLRSQGINTDSSENSSKPEDMVNIAAANPSA